MGKTAIKVGLIFGGVIVLCLSAAVAYGILNHSGGDDPAVGQAPRYILDEVQAGTEGIAILTMDGKRALFRTSDAALVTPFVYDGASAFKNGYARMTMGQQVHFVNEKGEIVLNTNELAQEYVTENKLCVYDPATSAAGFLDMSGKLVVDPLAGWMGQSEYHDGFAVMYKREKGRGEYYLIDGGGQQGPYLGNGWQTMLPRFTEGLIPAQDASGKWGYVNTDGEVAIQPQWPMVYSFSDGIACVQDDNQLFGFIDKQGVYISQPQWERAAAFKDGVCVVKKGSDYAVLNAKGEILADDKDWRFIGTYGEGYFPVVSRSGTASGYIDSTGKMALPVTEEGYKAGYSGFYGGLAVLLDGEDVSSALFTLSGRVVNDAANPWSNVVLLGDGMAAACNSDGKWALLKVTEDGESYVDISVQVAAVSEPVAPAPLIVEMPNDAAPAFAGNSDGIKVLFDGQYLRFTTPVLTKNGRAYYPMRELAELMGGRIGWNELTKTASCDRDGASLEFVMGENRYIRNSQVVNMDEGTAPFLHEDRAYVPIRYVAEGFGFSVAWDEESKTIRIS